MKKKIMISEPSASSELLKAKVQLLEIAAVTLKAYQKTNDQKYRTYAQQFITTANGIK